MLADVIFDFMCACVTLMLMFQSLAKHTRDRLEEGGPPPWIPFGQKIIKQSVPDKNFKSLDLGRIILKIFLCYMKF